MEREALQRELQALITQTEQARTAFERNKAVLLRDIDGLSRTYAELTVHNAAQAADLPSGERRLSEAGQLHALRDILTRMGAHASSPMPAADLAPSVIPERIASRLAEIRERAGLRLMPRVRIYNTNAAAESLPVVRVGEVAAVVWSAVATPLLSRDGRYQAAQGVEPLHAMTLDGVRTRVVLTDPELPPLPDAYAHQGFRGTMAAGGPIMWVILLLGLLALAVALERFVKLSWVRRRLHRARVQVDATVATGRLEPLSHLENWVARPLVIAATADVTQPDTEDRALQALMVIREHLQRRLSVLAVVAGVAPLLGLLGTVTGMIHTFAVVTRMGTSEPEQLAAGISEALLTTQWGLSVAIPTFVAHAFASRGARRVLALAEQAVLVILQERHDRHR